MLYRKLGNTGINASVLGIDTSVTEFPIQHNTGINASVLGFGAMRLPQIDDGTVDLERSVPLVRAGGLSRDV